MKTGQFGNKLNEYKVTGGSMICLYGNWFLNGFLVSNYIRL